MDYKLWLLLRVAVNHVEIELCNAILDCRPAGEFVTVANGGLVVANFQLIIILLVVLFNVDVVLNFIWLLQ